MPAFAASLLFGRKWAVLRLIGCTTACLAVAWSTAFASAGQTTAPRTSKAAIGTKALPPATVAANESDITLHLETEGLPAPVFGKSADAAIGNGQLVGTRDVWAISSRQADCAPHGAWGLQYWHLDLHSHRWHPANADDFLAADAPGVPTCFWLHGNRISHQEAFRVGWHAYNGLARQTPPERSFRFVIWSWPAAQIQGQLRDVRAKAYASDAHAYHLAKQIERMNPEVPVSLIGYSYGARTITGALHILGGGQVVGRSLGTTVDRVPMRAVLMAGALDSGSLAPWGRNSQALSQVDSMLVMVNPADPVLEKYPLLGGLFHRGPPAMGYTGAFGLAQWGDEGRKVSHWNVCRYVGAEHDWARYLCSSPIMAATRPYALFD